LRLRFINHEGGELRMKSTFYDVKLRQKVDAEVVGKTQYTVKGRTRYALKGKTSDGRNLTKFVSEADYRSASVQEV